MNNCPEAFLKWEQLSRDTVEFKKCYADLAGDLIAGLMLSQIVYWHLPDKHGRSKLRVKRDGFEWLAKTRQEWWDECRITTEQADLALKKLAKKGLVKTKLYKFNGRPTKHIRIDWDIFLSELQNLVNTPISVKHPNGFRRKTQIHLGEKPNSYTETTYREHLTETTSKASHVKRIEDSQPREGNLNTKESQDETSLANSTDNSSGDRTTTARDSKTVPLFSEKRKSEYGCTYDSKGWIQLPRHKKYRLPRWMAVRRMQAILALKVVPNAAEPAWDGTGKTIQRNGREMGFYNVYADEWKWEDETFRKDGNLSLKALREYAYGMVDLSQEGFNAMLEDLFIWSVQWCKEQDENAVTILKKTSVIDLFTIKDCEAFAIPM